MAFEPVARRATGVGTPRRDSKTHDLSTGDLTWKITMDKPWRLGYVRMKFSSPASPTVRLTIGGVVRFEKALSSAKDLYVVGEPGDEYDAGDDLEIYVSSS